MKRIEQPELARQAAEKFDRGIGKVAFKVELQTDSNGKESLRRRGINEGKEVVLDDEPYIGFGTKAAVWLLRLMPIESLL